jgi:DNA polymerase-4
MGKPVLVGGDPTGRGVVASASYEARKFGCRSAMPMAQALRLCPEAVVVQGTHGRYSEFSHQVQEVFERFSPLVEMAGLDEAYIDLTGTERLWGADWKAADRLRAAVLRETRLPCSVGLATNKLVAKVCSSLCKPAGYLRVLPGEEAAFLAPLQIRKLPGVGPKTAERLASFGLERIGDIVALGVETLEGVFGSAGRELWERAQGRHEGAVEPVQEAKSIGREHTFTEDVDDPERLLGMLSHLSELVATSLREDEVQARTITLKFRYADFQTHTASRTIAEPTDDEGVILSAARDLLRKHWTRRVRLRLIGVTTSNLVRSGHQLDLFDRERIEQRIRLHEAVDSIRDRHGFLSIERARSLGGSRGRKRRGPSGPDTPAAERQ